MVAQGKKLGKAVYVLSVDTEGGKIAHVNYVPPALKEKGLDARTWANRVTDIIGGKVRNYHRCMSLDLNSLFMFVGGRKRRQCSRRGYRGKQGPRCS